MSGLPPKPSFNAPRSDRDLDDRHFASRGGRSPPHPGRSSLPVDQRSYYPSRRTPPPRDRPYHRSGSPARVREDTYRGGGGRDGSPPRRNDILTSWEERDRRGRDSGREKGYDRSRNLEEVRQRAQRLAEEGRRRDNWRNRDDVTAGHRGRPYNAERRGNGLSRGDFRRLERSPQRYSRRSRSRSFPRSRSRSPSYSRLPRGRHRSPLYHSPSRSARPAVRSPHHLPVSKSAAKAARSTRDESPEEGLIIPAQSPRGRRISKGSRQDRRSSSSRSLSPPEPRRHMLKNRLESPPTAHTRYSQSPPTRLGYVRNLSSGLKALSREQPMGPALVPLTPSHEIGALSTDLTLAAPSLEHFSGSTSISSERVDSKPTAEVVESKDKGKAKEDLEGDCSLTPSLTPQDLAFSSALASPRPSSPAPLPPAAVRIPVGPRKMTPDAPRAERAEAMQIDRKAQLPVKRAPSPDPAVIKKRWEQRRGHLPQRDPIERGLENEQKEHTNYMVAISSYHQKNPGTMTGELRRRLQQCQHELIISQLDSDAAEKRRIVAETLFEKARTGILGENLPILSSSYMKLD